MKMLRSFAPIIAACTLMNTCRAPEKFYRPELSTDNNTGTYALTKNNGTYYINFSSGSNYMVSETTYRTLNYRATKYEQRALNRLIENDFSDDEILIISWPFEDLLRGADLNEDEKVGGRDLVEFMLSDQKKEIRESLKSKVSVLASVINEGK